MIHEKNIEKEWKEENLPPFDELILSWNITRPTEGQLLFYVKVKTNEWTPWLLYATWGSEGQSTFSSATQDASVKIYQDTVEILKEKGTGFQIKVVNEDPLPLNRYHLFVYTNGDFQESEQKISYSLPLYLQVPGLSQMTLNHSRHQDLCSPTSTTAVLRYLTNNHTIDPIHFAGNAWDKNFDIFGNWALNIAQASTELGSEWECWVERLNHFDDIYQQLLKGIPVIVSIRGPLNGSARSYHQGHLIVVTGYDPLQKQVLCMDPAFSSDKETHVCYDLFDFLQAWNRRGKIAYMFDKKFINTLF